MGRRRVAAAALGLLAACTNGGGHGGATPSTSAATATAVPTTPAPATAAPSTSASAAAVTCLPVGPAQAGETVTAVQVVGPDEAWAAGKGAILHTADGGRTWERQYGGPAELAAVDFVDARHGWAVGSGTDGLLATDDGRCWTARAPPTTPRLRAVHFVDTLTGWAVASDDDSVQHGGVLMKSTDGGRTWARQGGVGLGADVQSTCFTDASTGWVTAGGALAFTSDAGAHWQAVAVKQSHGAAWLAASVECAPGGAWVVGTSGGALSHFGHELYRVANGAGAATPVMAEPYTEFAAGLPPTPGSYPGPLSVVNAASAVFVGFSPPVDPGKTVRIASVSGADVQNAATSVPEMYQPAGASFASLQRGWVVGFLADLGGSAARRSVIAATSDGGMTWTVQYRTT